MKPQYDDRKAMGVGNNNQQRLANGGGADTMQDRGDVVDVVDRVDPPGGGRKMRTPNGE